MLWLAGGFFLFLRWIAKKFTNKWMWWLPFLFLMLAVFALAYAPIPFTDITVAGLGQLVVGWLFGLLGSAIGVTAEIIAGLVLFGLLIRGLCDLIKDHKPDGWAKTLVYTAPVLALVASGPIAPRVLEFTQMIGGIGPDVITVVAS